jgi:xanthine dehydrogenase accessory factor
MTDLGKILALWRELETTGTDYVLATVVATEGPSYRKPGARMLLAQDGRRAGTVSGGCLEAEVARRAWWLTSAGPVVERYSTQEEDGEHPYGSGCGGVIYLLLERRQTAGPLLAALEEAFNERTPIAIATVLEGQRTGTRAIAGVTNSTYATSLNGSADSGLHSLATLALESRASFEKTIQIAGNSTRVWVGYFPARPGLWIFSAGDDAKPLLSMARELGWFVAIADGRANLATRDRFPSADEVLILPTFDLPAKSADYLHTRPTDAAVVMTHSFDQDSRILASLLFLDSPLTYLGVLGPQRRTRELLVEAAHLLGLPDTAESIDRRLAELHAPTGLDLGGETPAAVALSILAEIQKVLADATARPLREIRAVKEIVPQCQA